MTETQRQEMHSLVERCEERKEYFESAEKLIEYAKTCKTKNKVKGAHEQYLIFWRALKESGCVNEQVREYHRTVHQTFKKILASM